MNVFKVVLLIIVNIHYIYAFIDGIYCGRENCYEVLGVNRDSTREEITKAYRKLARKFHPDVHRDEEAKQTATARFQVIASAYEVLRDEESRKDYNYMLDNPDEVYRHYYHYYRRIYAPKVDVRIVLVVTISVISAIQYWAAQSRYKEAIDYFLTVPKYRLKAQEIAKEDGLLNNNSATKRRNRFKTREEIKLEEENILRKIIEEKMDIKGAYSKPTVYDILWVQLVCLPYTIAQFVYFYIRWFYKFVIMKEEYGEEEKMYIIRRNMKLSSSQWSQLSDEEKEEYLELQLWKKEAFDVWKQERDDEQKAKLAESASYKRYRRWMRKGGPGAITFLDD
ncbi:DnaJ domain containing protein 5-like protein [Leptotrombidium deliense]|uniref:DnaJ domain containing protein 5-like protein n=1 Tax=Leptotrombidium deliense TaxID=299467 RepID=A0A443SW73_9ACAR|nr:DnaJ domain containing protein 5-like protein [Leptotrombidium deliense]